MFLTLHTGILVNLFVLYVRLLGNGRSIDSLISTWLEQIQPAITSFVNEQKSDAEKSDFISKVDYEMYDVGILHAAVRSQLMGASEDGAAPSET